MNELLPIDKATFWLFFGFWPLWIVWELALLWMRGQNPSVDLISMVARDRAYQLTALAFAWGSLAAHFWVNWRSVPPWVSPWGGIIFFVLIVAVIVWDWALWRVPYSDLPFWMRLARFPGTMLLLGFINGSLVFPQRGRPGMPF